MRPYETVEKDNEMKKKRTTQNVTKSQMVMFVPSALQKTPGIRTFPFVVTGNACQPYKDYSGDLLST